MSKSVSVGLTGGIASGKSAVADRLVEHGAILIDADLLSRQVVEPGTEGLAEIVETFGRGVLTEEGALDRAALAQVVFNDEDARMSLNAIIHPRVRHEAQLQREAAPAGSVVVEDIPLLVEGGQQDRFDTVVVVTAPHAERMRRLVEDRSMEPEEAERRIEAQATDAQRVAAADVVLDNSGTLEELHQQVDEFFAGLER
ncbi:dephospho-CoA kinase [Nesterenkonia sp. NBAIMH1]|uniref:dephospho-CoA kinase n=1 Tax=Nesterenkonia sp. NBAIMH1 TaxID=2600320 RepID=UPI0011B4D202|nr:dephospho-CoA kinase [Nesterenkonia sp. NBAIMH1]